MQPEKLGETFRDTVNANGSNIAVSFFPRFFTP
jgi:hypothetical protein